MNLLEAVLGTDIIFMTQMMEDNNQVIQAARKGYSPALKHLNRIERTSLEHLHDCIFSVDKQQNLSIEKVDTKAQRADVFTKRLPMKDFVAARAMLNIVDPDQLGNDVRSFLAKSKESRVKKSPAPSALPQLPN